MTDKIMDRYIRQTLKAHKTRTVTIAWQGGEPTMMGLDFFRKVIDTEKKYARPGVTIQNTLQTNGYLLNDKWCRFLAQNDFLVGLSLDGPKDLHDVFRRDKKGNSVHQRVIESVRLMQQFGVEFNILCTVNAINSQYPVEVYRYFRDEIGARYLQFIPIVERDNATGNQAGDAITARSVRPEVYGDFLIGIFDEWIESDVGTMFVQFFDGVLASYVRGHSTICVLQPTCGQGVALEHNGDVYSCDHYVEPEYLLGNIKQTSIEKLVGSEKQRQFGRAKSATLPRVCRECEFLFTCYGECPKNRVLPSPHGDGKVNWLCEGLKNFFAHTKEPMQRMAQLLESGRAAAEIMGGEK